MPKTITLDGVEFILTPVATTTEQPIIEPVQDPNVLHMTICPEINDNYTYLAAVNITYRCKWENSAVDEMRFYTHNCYTKENADIALSILQAKVELQTIATKLNDGRVIDWADNEQLKYTLYFSHLRNQIDWSGYYYNQYADIVCLERSFPEVALERMGKVKLSLALGKWK